MGLGINRGYGEYNPPEPEINLRSVSAKRASLIKWHKSHPHSFRLFQKADRLVDRSNERLRSYNETINDLEKRIGNASSVRTKLPLVASLKHVCNLKDNLESRIPSQMKERNMFANNIYEWKNLPLLDEQIAEAKRQHVRWDE